jgi:phosphoglycerate dehydrogenase-like enzyme
MPKAVFGGAAPIFRVASLIASLEYYVTVLGFMIDCGRYVTEATSAYRTGRIPDARMGRQLKGATLGIIGYGAIGAHLAELGLALGMTVLVADPHKRVTRPMVQQVQFADLLAKSDFVVCLAIANEQTEKRAKEQVNARVSGHGNQRRAAPRERRRERAGGRNGNVHLGHPE